MDTSSDADAPVENFKLVANTLANYNHQKSENEKLIVKLENITEQLKALYNIDFDTGYLPKGIENDANKTKDVYEVAAEKLVLLSNENYKILNNLQYQLRVRNKLIKFVGEYSKLIDLIKGYLLTNDFEIYKSSAGNEQLVQILKDDLLFLEQKNKTNKNTDYKHMYTTLSKKLKDILETLEKLERS